MQGAQAITRHYTLRWCVSNATLIRDFVIEVVFVCNVCVCVCTVTTYHTRDTNAFFVPKISKIEKKKK